jgi:hypothetical protein
LKSVRSLLSYFSAARRRLWFAVGSACPRAGQQVFRNGQPRVHSHRRVAAARLPGEVERKLLLLQREPQGRNQLQEKGSKPEKEGDQCSRYRD